MNCKQCEDLIGDFLDGALRREDQALLNTHLEQCLSCTGMRDEVRMIIAVAKSERDDIVAPQNAQDLWTRIRDVIEIEEFPTAFRSAQVQTPAQLSNESFWSRVWNKRWELSLPQMTGAFAALVFVAALVTVLGLQIVRSLGDVNAPFVAGNGASNFSGATVADPKPTVEDLLRQQRTDIENLNQRIAQRQARWTPEMREAFNRSVAVVDQAVEQSVNELRANPSDDISNEMLNVAFENKEDLLRQFSEF